MPARRERERDSIANPDKKLQSAHYHAAWYLAELCRFPPSHLSGDVSETNKLVPRYCLDLTLSISATISIVRNFESGIRHSTIEEIIYQKNKKKRKKNGGKKGTDKNFTEISRRSR